jgi:hypothetical protein
MTHRELLLFWSTVGFEILLCVLVYFRDLQRRLPFFTTYSTFLLTCTIGVALFYHHFGFRSVASYNAYWFATGLIIIARSFAIGELCRYELRAYQGIWALTWRILTLLMVFFLGHASVNAWGEAGGIPIYGLTIERDIATSSIVLLVALLLIRNYYGFSLEPLHKWIATGIFLIAIVDVMNNTILRDTLTGHLFFWLFGRYASSWPGLTSQVEGANDLWGSIRTSGDIISVGIWCYALRKPLPVPARDPVLLPAEVYEEFSPEVNLRLRAFNDRLLELLKP